MTGKFHHLTLAVGLIISPLAHAAPPDPHAEIHRAMVGIARDDCRGAGTARARAIRNSQGFLTPRQREAFAAGDYAECVAEGMQIAEIIYTQLHTGRSTQHQMDVCAIRIDGGSTTILGDTLLVKLLSCLNSTDR